nr:pentatricopeptide repeat-containing protein At5g04780, mitochondrial-like [Nicotiana tomentosiformis]
MGVINVEELVVLVIVTVVKFCFPTVSSVDMPYGKWSIKVLLEFVFPDLTKKRLLTEFTFPSVLKACSIEKELLLGKQLHGIVVVTGFEFDVFVANTLVVMRYCSRKENSWILVKLGYDSDPFSSNATCRHALDMLNQLRRSGIFPNMFTLSSALKACAALELPEYGCEFDLMPEKDLIALNVMISGYSQNEEDNECLDLFVQKYNQGTRSDQTSLLAILNSAAGLQAANVKRVHVLSMNLLDDATRTFDECPIRDLPSFTSLITAYALYGQGEDAMKLYLKLQDMGFKPDSFVCSSLLNECANLSVYEYGKQIHAHVLK